MVVKCRRLYLRLPRGFQEWFTNGLDLESPYWLGTWIAKGSPASGEPNPSGSSAQLKVVGIQREGTTTARVPMFWQSPSNGGCSLSNNDPESPEGQRFSQI